MANIDLNQCDGACHSCIKKYISKHSLKKGERFLTPCKGIPLEPIPSGVLETTGIDREMALAMVDPVHWASKFLDWHCLDEDKSNWERKTLEGTIPTGLRGWDPEYGANNPSVFHRPYQAEMLRCTSKRKVFRIGRQAGKCLVSGSMVQMADGTMKPVEDIQDGELVASLDGFQIKTAAAYKTCNGVKPTALLELMDGRTANTSLNHPFLVRRNIGRETTGGRRAIFREEWVELQDLKPKDYVAVPKKLPEGQERLDFRAIYKLHVLGLMIADGNMTGGNCRFSNQNPQILSLFKEHLKGFQCELKHYDCDAQHDYHIIGSGIERKHQLKEWFRKLGLQGLDSHKKYIPEFAMKLCNNDIRCLLYAMYGCDGWASVDKNGKPEIGYCTVSKKLANQMVSILARFGIYASMRLKTVNFSEKKFFAHQVIISRKEDIVTFVDQIGLMGKDSKALEAKTAALKRNSSPKTDAYQDGEIVFIPIRSITDTGNKMTWDLTIPEHHTLIADNIISHNTECLVISILFNIFTNQNFRVVVVAPFQSQIDLIFKKINEHIKGNVNLSNSVARNVKAPQYQVELHNGSMVTGFTAGTRSGQDAGASRGQCLAKGTRVRMASGLDKNIEDIEVGDMVLTYEEDWKSSAAKVTHVFEPNQKEVIQLTTKSGRVICSSWDHSFFTRAGEVELSQLSLGDCIAIPRKTHKYEEYQSDVLDDEVKRLAYLIGDGYISTRKISFTNNNSALINEYLSLFPAEDFRVEQKVGQSAKGIILRGRSKVEFRDRLEQYGLLNKHSFNKFIPDILKRESSLRQQALFLSRLYATDGWASIFGNQYEIGYCTTSRQLADDIVSMLNNFNIIASIQVRDKEWEGFNTKQQYILKIRDGDQILSFLDQINIFGKEASCNQLREHILNSKGFTRNQIDYFTKEELEPIFLKYGLTVSSIRYKYNIDFRKNKSSRGNLLKLYRATEIPELLNLVYRDVAFDEIINIQSIGVQETYDIEVATTQKFIADNIVVHNSAHMLVFDEADYLSSGDIDAALAIITNFPDATVWMSSTPTGRRERFFETCRSKLFREFHYPSYVNPNWTEDTDALYREQLTEDGYKHEVLAEFGEQEEGVYQARYLELAQEEYTYESMAPNPKWMYMMGVDWNDIKIGTTIAVVGFNPDSGVFYLVDKYVMPKSERTQLGACQKIAEMNRVWHPDSIYVDKGFGTTQIEILHKFGYDSLKSEGKNSPNARLRYNVKPYDFGGNVEITDLFTHEKVPKKAKPFLIENSVRRFETCSFKYPQADDKFTKALLGYIVSRVSQSGQPVYEQQDTTVGDHFLDAVNLALVAFTLEKSEFTKPKYDSKIAFSTDIAQILSGGGKPDTIHQREKLKPKSDRGAVGQESDHILQSEGGDFPGANTNMHTGVKLWAWPGFGHDEPRPNARSLGEAFSAAEGRVFGRGSRKHSRRPKRKNI